MGNQLAQLAAYSQHDLSFLLFFILWMLDYFFTIKVLEGGGAELNMNRVVRWFIRKFNGPLVGMGVLKIVTLVVLGAVWWYAPIWFCWIVVVVTLVVCAWNARNWLRKRKGH